MKKIFWQKKHKNRLKNKLHFVFVGKPNLKKCLLNLCRIYIINKKAIFPKKSVIFAILKIL